MYQIRERQLVLHSDPNGKHHFGRSFNLAIAGAQEKCYLHLRTNLVTINMRQPKSGSQKSYHWEVIWPFFGGGGGVKTRSRNFLGGGGVNDSGGNFWAIEYFLVRGDFQEGGERFRGKFYSGSRVFWGGGISVVREFQEDIRTFGLEGSDIFWLRKIQGVNRQEEGEFREFDILWGEGRHLRGG